MYVNTSAGVKLNGVSTVKLQTLWLRDGIHGTSYWLTNYCYCNCNSNFTTLVGLLNKQGLVPTLGGTASSPFTVFAPSNGALQL
jgi:uncharacterized surface protein with fasciclin (FAS1) repeats